MTKSKNTHFAVGRTTSKGVFREIKTGDSVTRVMNKRVYEQATERASEKIREYLYEKKAS